MRLYHTNDMHNHNEALLWLAKNMTEGEIYLDSGDALAGSNTVYRRFEPILREMGKIHCRAMAMGNREFNYQRSVLDLRSKERKFPLLCSNLSDLREFPGESCTSLVDRAYKDWQNNQQCGRWMAATNVANLTLIGATPVQYPHGSFWEKLFKFRFFDAQETTANLAQKIFVHNKNILLLSHLGLDRDLELATHLPKGTWILGGHTHTILQEPIEKDGVFITQTGCYGKYIGILDYNTTHPELSSYQLIKV